MKSLEIGCVIEVRVKKDLTIFCFQFLDIGYKLLLFLVSFGKNIRLFTLGSLFAILENYIFEQKRECFCDSSISDTIFSDVTYVRT